MPRKGPAPKRPLVIDPVYASPLVTQLVNKVLFSGKRSIAESIVYGALEGTRDKTGTDPVITLKRALDNVKPTIEVKSRRVGGANFQVPVEVRPVRRVALAMRRAWYAGTCPAWVAVQIEERRCRGSRAANRTSTTSEVRMNVALTRITTLCRML